MSHNHFQSILTFLQMADTTPLVPRWKYKKKKKILQNWRPTTKQWTKMQQEKGKQVYQSDDEDSKDTLSLWTRKVQYIVDTLNQTFWEVYKLLKRLSVDQGCVPFTGQLSTKCFKPKNNKKNHMLSVSQKLATSANFFSKIQMCKESPKWCYDSVICLMDRAFLSD